LWKGDKPEPVKLECMSFVVSKVNFFPIHGVVLLFVFILQFVNQSVQNPVRAIHSQQDGDQNKRCELNLNRLLARALAQAKFDKQNTEF
jgi:hypothetical protein